MQEDVRPERSTDLLRRVLPLMSRHAAAMSPVSYAVWYEYVAQSSTTLCAAVDESVRRLGRLDEATTQAIYDQHLAGTDSNALREAADGLQRLLGGMASSAREAGNRTARFGDSLQRLSASLEVESERQTEAISSLIGDTREMQSAMADLQMRLRENQLEIERLREEVRQARHEAAVDALTSLANRRAFDAELARQVDGRRAADAAAAGSAPWLLMGDIDHFKQINDSWGHGFGDRVLCAVAQVLKSLAPEGALAARLGGEEFGLLLPGGEPDAVQALAERIRQRISAARVRRHGSEETLARVTLSIGMTALAPDDTAEGFIERADRALYASKQSGRDRVTRL
jgi:diguanylate cyclase